MQKIWKNTNISLNHYRIRKSKIHSLLVIQACENKEPENFRIPEYNPENWDFAVHSSPMLKMIWKVCGWEENQTYRSDGVCYKEHRLVEFDLEQAEILSFVEI